MKIAIVILGVLLVFSNGCWLYNSIDRGITLSYRDKQIHELDETRKQLMGMLPAMSQNFSKQEVIQIASSQSNEKTFEKDGCTWVGWVGLKFNQNGILESVSPAWFYGGLDPCYPIDNK